jgi:hypothetical protein
MRANLDGSDAMAILTGATLPGNPNQFKSFGGVAVDTADNYLFVGDGRYLIRSRLDGSERTNLVDVETGSGHRVYDVEVDRANGRVYFSTLKDIWRVDLNGQNAQRIVDNSETSAHYIIGLAVDPINDMIYWSDFWSTPSAGIWAANLNGSNVHLLRGTAGTSYDPFDVELDAARQRLYFVNYNLGGIGWMNSDGAGPINTIVTQDATDFGMSFDAQDDMLYFSARPTPGDKYTQRVGLDGSGLESLGLHSYEGAYWMDVWHVPEPAAATLLALGTLGLLWRRPSRRLYSRK